MVFIVCLQDLQMDLPEGPRDLPEILSRAFHGILLESFTSGPKILKTRANVSGARCS